MEWMWPFSRITMDCYLEREVILSTLISSRALGLCRARLSLSLVGYIAGGMKNIQLQIEGHAPWICSICGHRMECENPGNLRPRISAFTQPPSGPWLEGSICNGLADSKHPKRFGCGLLWMLTSTKGERSDAILKCFPCIFYWRSIQGNRTSLAVLLVLLDWH